VSPYPAQAQRFPSPPADRLELRLTAEEGRLVAVALSQRIGQLRADEVAAQHRLAMVREATLPFGLCTAVIRDERHAAATHLAWIESELSKLRQCRGEVQAVFGDGS